MELDFKDPPETSLAALESLSLPMVQEIVLFADIRCANCRKRLAKMMTKMRETESVVVNVLEKTVTVIYRHPSAAKQPSCSRKVAIGREVLRMVSKFASARKC